eukprot:1615303-Rhodomonas_salina.3
MEDMRATDEHAGARRHQTKPMAREEQSGRKAALATLTWHARCLRQMRQRGEDGARYPNISMTTSMPKTEKPRPTYSADPNGRNTSPLLPHVNPKLSWSTQRRDRARQRRSTLGARTHGTASN